MVNKIVSVKYVLVIQISFIFPKNSETKAFSAKIATINASTVAISISIL